MENTSVQWSLYQRLYPVSESLKLKGVLKWRDIYIQFGNVRVMLLTGGLKIQGSVRMEGP